MNISQIKEKLQKPLLGLTAQKKMAPKGRDLSFPKNKLNYTKSAVLLTLIPKNGELFIPLIKRTKSNGSHSGQISFPGGKYEKTDVDFEYTAKRETFEEIGLKISEIEIVGKLSSLFIPVSEFIVYPFVGVYAENVNFQLNKTEVDELILVKLTDLQKARAKKIEIRNIKSKVYEIPYFDVENQKVWGATAMILNEFLEMID